MNLIMISPYLMFFSKNRLCNFFWGPLGCAAALSCVLISDSRTTIVTVFLVLAFYAVVSIRHVYSTVYALVVYVAGAALSAAGAAVAAGAAELPQPARSASARTAISAILMIFFIFRFSFCSSNMRTLISSL